MTTHTITNLETGQSFNTEETGISLDLIEAYRAEGIPHDYTHDGSVLAGIMGMLQLEELREALSACKLSLYLERQAEARISGMKRPPRLDYEYYKHRVEVTKCDFALYEALRAKVNRNEK